MPIDLQAWAVSYAEMGWMVHPLKPGEKVPATPHGCKDATCDVDRIQRWWTKYPDHNIGLATGHVFDVLDLDGTEGAETFASWWEDNGLDPLPSILVASTPGGGEHWYGVPTGAGNRAGLLAKVDWRGKGGYVVAPPSVHPNGGSYGWAEGEPDDLPLMVWPPALVAILMPPPITTRINWAPREWKGEGDGTSYGIAGLMGEAQKLAAMAPNTGRNHQLYASMCNVKELILGGQIAEGYAVQVMTEAAHASGLAEREICTTVRSAMKHPVVPRRPV